MYYANQNWKLKCVSSGLSSGEGLIDRVRDRQTETDKDGNEKVIDHGVDDKRLTVIESEFAVVLAVMERGGNTLNSIIRTAWDGGNLSVMTRKKNSLNATDPHISIISHITTTELKSRLTQTDTASGFANRFLFILARRSKLLPMGGNLSDHVISDLGNEVKECLCALPFEEMEAEFSEGAKNKWVAAYLGELNNEDRPGMLGAVTYRGPAQVLRIALVYAILDKKKTIEIEHVEAALAIWRYADESARMIFGDMLGDNVADTILVALKQVHPAGLNRTEIMALFGNHAKSADLLAALIRLKTLGRARYETVRTRGPSVETWFYTPAK